MIANRQTIISYSDDLCTQEVYSARVSGGGDIMIRTRPEYSLHARSLHFADGEPYAPTNLLALSKPLATNQALRVGL